jgi:hypothetical protein
MLKPTQSTLLNFEFIEGNSILLNKLNRLDFNIQQRLNLKSCNGLESLQQEREALIQEIRRDLDTKRKMRLSHLEKEVTR